MQSHGSSHTVTRAELRACRGGGGDGGHASSTEQENPPHSAESQSRYDRVRNLRASPPQRERAL